MNTRRFKKVIAAVEKAPAKAFKIHQWRNDCGTAGCAVGHYCMDNPRANLVLKKIRVNCIVDFKPALRSNPAIQWWDAIGMHFGISNNEAIDLFGVRYHGYRPITKAKWLAKARKFLAEHSG